MSGARTVPVLVDQWVVGDHGDPPVIGRVEQYHLVFVEHADEDRADPGVEVWDVVAEPQRDGAPQPTPDADTLVDRYDVLLHGPGWVAHWRSPRPIAPGALRVRGLLVMDWPGTEFPAARVRGRVQRLRLVTETVLLPGGDPHEHGPTVRERRAREVPDCRDLFTDPPDPGPAGGPRERNGGWVVDLDPDRAGPVLPGAIAAHDDVLWIADRDGPTVLRIRAPRTPAPQAMVYTWDGPRLESRGRSRQLHADGDGCWVTDQTGTRRLEADGAVRLLDRFAPRALQHAVSRSPLVAARGDTLAAVVHDRDGRQPAVLRLVPRGGAPSSVVLPARVVHGVVAHGEGFLVMLGEQGEGVSRPSGVRLAAVDLDGRLATGALVAVGGLRECPLSGPEPTFVYGSSPGGDQRLFRVRPDGVGLDDGTSLPGPISGAWSVAGRLFVTGPVRDLEGFDASGQRGADPADRAPGRPVWSLVELDPGTLGARHRVVLPCVQHPPAIDAAGTVWVSADGVRAVPTPHHADDPASAATARRAVTEPLDLEPLDLEALAPSSPESGGPAPAGRPRSRFLDIARRVGRPNELPVPVVWSAVLGRGAGLVVALVGAQVHRSGIELALTVRSRYRRAILPVGVPGSDGIDGALLLGVEFADGRSTTSHAHRNPARNVPERDDQLVLHHRGGGGDDHHVNVTYFLSPLPPPGDLTLHCLWSAHGVPETATVLDIAPVLRAAAGVEVLWPGDDPGRAPEDTGAAPPGQRATRRAGWPHPRPDVPADGWFARWFDDAP